MVPKGYRPKEDADIEKLLDAVGTEPMSEEKKQRMLRKIKGLEPVFAPCSPPTPVTATELTEQEQELVALHRGRNKPLPPDLAAKVKAMEERAAKKRESLDGTNNG
jgi:hypothetical protein